MTVDGTGQQPRLRPLLAATLLAVVVALPFLQLSGAEFINFDDPSYVTENPYVLQGVSVAGLRWALTTGTMANWNPLTWLSHMVDVQLFGMHAGGHHLTSVALHVVSTVVLFAALQTMGAARGRSAVVALLFGLHPLHVESVAWVSERKDVLSTTFLFVALWAYAVYARRPSAARYAAVVAAFAFGLMCKPMLVTFPFVLLLLDVWPLERGSAVPLRRLLLEKVPLLAMSVVISAVTLVTQRGAMGTVEAYPFSRRVANAALAYGVYLRKTVWPVDLSCFYPYPADVSWLAVGAAALALAAASVAALAFRCRHPYVFVGWFWFAGTLVPVIGLVQVGAQALADRYTYVPLVGVFIVLVWGACEFGMRWHVRDEYLRGGAVVVLVACFGATWFQVSRWHDNVTLFRHALAVTHENYLAALQIGAHFDKQANPSEAARYYETALRIKPDYAEAHNDLGLVLAKRGDTAAAFAHYDAALAGAPLYADAHYNRGVLLQQSGRLDEAAQEYRRTLALRPSDVSAHSNLGAVLQARGDLEEAQAHLEEAVRLWPDHVPAHINLGVVLRARGDVAGAIAQYRESIRLDPRVVDAHYDLGNVLLQQGDREGAVAAYREALRLEPDYGPARDMLAHALAAPPS